MPFKRIILANILLFAFITMQAQPTFNYNAAWKKVDELMTKKGLTASAIKQVQTIYTAAQKEKNDAQLIKALIFRINLQQQKEEDADLLSIQQLEKEIRIAKEPAKSILTNLLAETYWQYLQNNRWKFYNRTNTVQFQKNDISTWTVDDLHQRIATLYLQSLTQEKLLKQTRLDKLDPILEKGNVRHLRPTLFDLLAHRALDYFENDERTISKPADAFELNSASAFDPAADFINRKFPTADSSSLHHKALLLYQQLIRFHLNDQKPDALIDVDLRRIEFVNRFSTHENKDEQYRLALNHLIKQYNNQPVISQAVYLLAKDYTDFAATYDFTQHKTEDDLNPRWYYKKALELCNTVINQKEKTEGKVNCNNLIREIKNKEVTLQTEKVNLPNQPFRSLLTYRNTPVLYFRIIPVTKTPDEETERENYWEAAYWNKLAKLKPVQQFQYNMPATEDYQVHKAEIKIPSLPVGTYLIIASANEEFTTAENILSAQYVHVSALAWIYNGQDFFVLNRETGKPIQQANVQIWKQAYNYNDSKYELTKGALYKTNANGYFRFAGDKTSEQYRLDVSYEKDRLFLDDGFYNYNWRGEETIQDELKNRKAFLFSDRSIYRPGQTVYFKGIVITNDAPTGKPKVVSNYKTTLYLYDANYQKIDSIKVSTNEFGSYTGNFQLPQGGLNGQFFIKDETIQSQLYFSVEEYKRPKFYVEYPVLKGTYKVGDEIKVTGNAKAYAGNNIDNANVKYRVVREPRLLYPWLCWKWGWPPTESQEIAHGETTTKADGSFEIIFTAIPDKKVRKELEPVFDYKVIADVTDLNGETRTGETTVSIGYKSLFLEIDLPLGETMMADSLKQISISTKNSMGAFEKANVTVSFYQLETPKRLIRDRYWEQPDQFLMNEQEYISNFPYDEYKDETKKENWKRGEKVFERTDSSLESGKFNIENKKFAPGWYAIEAITKDKNDKEVKNIAFIQLTEANEQPAVPTYVWDAARTTTKEPGQTASYRFGSSANDLFVIEQQEKEFSKEPVYAFFNISNQQKEFTHTVTENNRGGFGSVFSFVKHNRFYNTTRFVNVPYSNKELKITFETYRNKTLPGSAEEWKVTISGSKGEKAAAELLTSMYDASLDQFKPHGWYKPNLYGSNSLRNNWMKGGFGSIPTFGQEFESSKYETYEKQYDELLSLDGFTYGNMKPLQGRAPGIQMKAAADSKLEEVVVTSAAGEPGAATNLKIRGNTSLTGNLDALIVIDGVIMTMEEYQRLNPGDILEVNVLKGDAATSIYGSRASNGVILIKTKKGAPVQEPVKVRKNFSETAFFFPQLQTDSNGNVIVKFTMPESLTKWKWQLLSHTKDASFGIAQQEIVTQKELMVQPFAPRFLREGDRFLFTAKITNLTDKEITGNSQLQFLNASTLQPVDAWFQNLTPFQYFTVAAGQSTVVSFQSEVPYNFNEAITYRIVAKANDKSDGEEMTLPVLTNRMLVTESLPLNMRGDGTKNFSFTKLLNSNSPTLQHHRFTVEFTSNPVWYAVQALPYMMEYPYECAEQTWNRFYANALAYHIVSKMPRIKAVMEQWKTKDTSALLSNLQKNEELKAVLLAETPWVLQAKNEEQQKKNIALLFDMVRMSKELEKALNQLLQMQSTNGGFVWFKGGPDDRYITQYIVTGIGHLQKLNALPAASEKTINTILAKAIPYLDNKLKEDHEWLKKQKVKLNQNNISYTQIQYLYMRSMLQQLPQTRGTEAAFTYYSAQGKQYWLQQSRYMQGMLALTLHRNKDAATANAIVKSLRENALMHEEMGMYWKEFNSGYYWYQAPVEAQALMIEVFHEAAKDAKAVSDLQTWLLKQKQVQNWKTTIATAEACYALLLQGTNVLEQETFVEVKAGMHTFSSATEKTEAGTGYFKRSVDGSLLTPQMGNITVKIINNKTQEPKNNSQLPSWSAAYWQYFENLDKITSAETPLKLQKKYFVERNTAKGPVLTPVEEGTELKVGDKLKVRIELRVDRNMEYVHMKDMRASCMEPVNVLSTYKWQDGLGYYESTKDASTNFFFDRLPKGTYVFEYPLFITHAGTYSAGITTIQSMYAPEFTSHSEGVRVRVKE
ncbi:MAG: TonB-dependent receptor plug domain-containing protein [Lacibacter sp.]|jgi:TonB-dependent SusC/RagA subfamily outer membrane receptor